MKAALMLSREKSKACVKKLDVQVYGSELLQNREAVCWWANKHNDLQKLQRSMKTQDMVRNVKYGEDQMKQKARTILNVLNMLNSLINESLKK